MSYPQIYIVPIGFTSGSSETTVRFNNRVVNAVVYGANCPGFKVAINSERFGGCIIANTIDQVNVNTTYYAKKPSIANVNFGSHSNVNPLIIVSGSTGSGETDSGNKWMIVNGE